MRYLAVIFAAMAFATCSTTPGARPESQKVSQTQVAAAGMQNTQVDSAAQFLLTSAASDFHAHGPSGPLRFRGVRLGHLMNPDGTTQYRMCGEFLTGKEEDNAKWTAFVTIKTSGYEQYIGGQAATFCQEASFTWDKVSDLSASLQSRLESLR